MRRREFIALTGSVAAWPIRVGAQSARKRAVPLAGYLSPGGQTPLSKDVFREGLQDLGYVVGQNIAIEYRRGNGAFDRLSDFAAELVALDVDVIVAIVTQAALAAKKATAVADPVGAGLIASLSHPGGNVTGTSSIAADLVGKQLELIQELVRKESLIGVLWNPANLVFQQLQLKQAEEASRYTGVQLQQLPARSPEEFPSTFAAIRKEGARALVILGDPMFSQHAEALSKLAIENQLPTVVANRRSVEAGGLIAYGPSYPELTRRAAVYVDKILKGAKPSDLPVEQPTKFELLINLKTAKSLDITIPPPLLSRADEVIE
jgi:putative tryptophan/tyrosine transport system substrate-binding protein